MKHHFNLMTGSRWSLCAGSLLAGLGLLASVPAWADVIDLSSIPLSTLEPPPPRPNVMFILDDSGSMDRDFLPETTGGSSLYTGKCFGNSAYNKVFYNPTTTYALPPKADGSGKMTSPVFTAAWINGFDTTSTKTNLSSSTPTWSSAGTTNNKFYYSTGTSPNCTTVTTLPAAQQTNYAIWYSFYRTRLLMMKSVGGIVLNAIDAPKFRVGFTTINDTNATDGDKFHNIGDFDKLAPGSSTKTNKTAILEKLYKASTATYTPLRPALVKAGRYFGNRLALQTDPTQWWCQSNYALLTTDGFWNTKAEPGTSKYKPLRLDGTAFTTTDGDSALAAPYKDKYPYTLADIAAYYYNTDLRTDVDTTKSKNRTDNKGVEIDHQKMFTITVGLGVSGELPYSPSYSDADLLALTWPNPLADPNDSGHDGDSVIARIDDLWHAAVNGHQRYYSAGTPSEVIKSLTDAFNGVATNSGAGAKASISALTPTNADNSIYVPAYAYETDADQKVTTPWQGDLSRYHLTIDAADNVTIPDISKTTPDWSARAKLDARTVSGRTIYFNKSGARTIFNYTNLPVAWQSYFDKRCEKSTATENLSQCVNFKDGGGKDDFSKVTGASLVDYLRGDKTYQVAAPKTSASINNPFRYRKSIMGDIVNSSPVYVGRPPFRYGDTDYAAFVAADEKTPRTPMVYVGGNDGMLHAFNAATGEEEWAFVPLKVMPNLWHLADANYDANHRAYVDATPTLADVYDPATKKWRTLLVGGLSGGGNEFYALDVTDPSKPPEILWEFTDAAAPNQDATHTHPHLGLSFGNPIVTKLKDGTWVAIFTSGYNNHLNTDIPTADTTRGHGYLYIVDAIKGTLIGAPIPTDGDGGSKDRPSNLGKINSWIHADTDNTTRRVYGGDMLGNLWRFDIDNRIDPSPGNEAFLLGQTRDVDGKFQPITVKPMLTAIGVRPKDDRTLVWFGTGKLLDPKDLNDPTDPDFGSKQTMYFVKDDATTLALNNLHANNKILVASTTTPLDLKSDSVQGFYLDLTAPKERVNLDGVQFNGELFMASNIPVASVTCEDGGTSKIYHFNLKGVLGFVEDVSTLMVGGTRLFRPKKGKPGDGSNGGKIVWTDAGGGLHTYDVAGSAGATAGVYLRRSAWREIFE